MYPGRAVRRNDTRTDVVKMLQSRLSDKGITTKPDGNFGPKTEAALKLFQTRCGVTADGIAGPITWALLFGTTPATNLAPSSALTGAAMRLILSQEGVREVGGPNKGPEVERFLGAVGLPAGYPWCVALQYWGFQQAAANLNMPNPLPQTAGVLRHWDMAPEKVKIGPDAPTDDLRNITPGTLFCIRHGEEHGHMGMVLAAESGGLRTIEGNTNVAGSREGDGVYKRVRRYSDINLGYLDWGRV